MSDDPLQPMRDRIAGEYKRLIDTLNPEQRAMLRRIKALEAAFAEILRQDRDEARRRAAAKERAASIRRRP